MATYKIKKKTADNGSTEEILLPISSIEGLQTALDGKQEIGSYVTTNTTQTIPANKTYTGTNTFSNGKFSIRANSANDDSWIQLTNSGNSAYYAFGVRRPYTTYGLQLKYHPDASNQDSSRPGEANGTGDIYYDIYHRGNYTKIPLVTSSAPGLMSAADKAKLDGAASGTHRHTITPSGSVSSTFSGDSLTSTGTYKPSGEVSSTFTGTTMTSTGTFTPEGTISTVSHKPSGSVTVSATTSATGNYTPVGSVSKPTISVSPSFSTVLASGAIKGTFADGGLTLSLSTTTDEVVKSATASLDSTPTFTGTKVNISASFSGDSFSVTPTFTGTSGSVSVSGTTVGSVGSTFSGTNANISVSGTPSGTITSEFEGTSLQTTSTPV